MDPDSFYHERIRLNFPRATSGPFIYRESWENAGYLEVDGERRCESERLLFLLNYVQPPPLLTKKGKPRVYQPTPHKDETGKFYRAQCIHYGIKPSSDKHRAKAALLAYAESNDGKFIVPKAIQEIKVKLESEFNAKKAEYDTKMADIEAREQKVREKARNKRKRDEEELLDMIAKKPKKNAAFVFPANLKRGGAYTVVATAISEGWDTIDTFTLRFCQSQSSRHVWGDFDFGVFEGTFRSEKLSKTKGCKIKCHWRGRETGEGESTSGPENKLELQFFDEKTFRGTMYWDCVGTFDIAGKLNLEGARNQVFSDYIRGWKEEYRRLNEANYSAECSGRWGGWQEPASPDRAAESDTTDDGVSDHSENEEESDGEEVGDESEEEELYAI